MGTAPATKQLLRTLKEAGVRHEDIAMHFHDTFGQALINTMVSLDHGIRAFDSAVGGLGGWITGEIGKENGSSAGKATLSRLRREAGEA
ncbi:hypothetical protein LTR53_018957 [Teratosphaeriaceae sp. CCFEE 6253]|nr:hypothetical protein LTR53_018957 [Teratosphaeriaceae sp. CCFEE 6253]